MPVDHKDQRADRTQWKLTALLTGKAKSFGPHGEQSGILKQPCSGGVYVQKTGISDDEQGDLVRHGGVEKAVHHYAFDHYSAWRDELPGSAPLFGQPGVFGENFSSLGMTEGNVYVGDIFQVGTAVLQVSQARQPCWRLNVRTSISSMAMRVQRSGRTGWYYRVIAPGLVKAGDEIMLLQRPNPDWSLQKILHYLYRESLDREALSEIANLLFLSQSWRKLAQTRLERRAVEDWSKRLYISQKK